MSRSVDLYGTAYSNFATHVLEQVRRDTYGEDFGQSSWVTADEYRRFFRLLGLSSTDHILDVGCGSGGPAMFLGHEVGCRVTGVDFNEAGIQAGLALVKQASMQDQIDFWHADIREPLPFPDQTFDVVICLDVICHILDRCSLFREWSRVLRPGGRMLYTDPVVVTGLIDKEEFAAHSSTGDFAFGPPGVNEKQIGNAGFELMQAEDVTENEVEVSRRWFDARQQRASELIKLEAPRRSPVCSSSLLLSTA